jgi:hypothetical protein
MTPTLEQRVAALEQRELKLRDLPLKQLLDKLEQDWTPDARTLLLKKSIDADKLADATVQSFLQLLVAADVSLAYSTNTAVFTAANVSAVKTVTHGLGATPALVLVSSTGGAYNVVYATNNVGGTTFDVQAETASGAVVTYTGTFYWLAIG